MHYIIWNLTTGDQSIVEAGGIRLAVRSAGLSPGTRWVAVQGASERWRLYEITSEGQEEPRGWVML